MILPPHRRGDLTNTQWQKLKPLLPPQKPTVGRPSNDHHRTINGILWILRTGAPWRDLPEGYGAWETVSGRFYRWRRTGLWQRILARLQSTCGCRWQTELGHSFRRWQCHPCPPACSRGEKGELNPDSELSAIEQVQQREALLTF